MRWHPEGIFSEELVYMVSTLLLNSYFLTSSRISTFFYKGVGEALLRHIFNLLALLILAADNFETNYTANAAFVLAKIY